MSILQILVEVPHEIMNGLNSGYYTRDAAGIIRWAKGTEHGGEIVAHLREISADWQTAQPIASNPMFPVGALMAVQVAGFVYLGYQLKQIQAAIRSLHQDVTAILKHVEIIRQQQWLDKLNLVAHGVEHLNDVQFRPNLLEEARLSFGKARGEIRYFLSMQSPVTLIEHLPQTDLLIQGVCISFAGEYVCLQRQRAELEEVSHVCQRYSSIVSDVRKKIMQAPPIHRPPIQSAQYLKYFPTIKPLNARVQRVEERMIGETEFVKTFAKVDAAALEELAKPKVGNDNRKVLVVYP